MKEKFGFKRKGRNIKTDEGRGQGKRKSGEERRGEETRVEQSREE